MHLVYQHHIVGINSHGQADDHWVAAFINEYRIRFIYDGIVQVLRKNLQGFTEYGCVDKQQASLASLAGTVTADSFKCTIA